MPAGCRQKLRSLLQQTCSFLDCVLWRSWNQALPQRCFPVSYTHKAKRINFMPHSFSPRFFKSDEYKKAS